MIRCRPARLGNGTADEANAELEMFLSFLYDELGEATVRRWFVERRYARDSTPPKTI